MAFELNSVVPWGRNLSEYRQMFALSDTDLNAQIASFGDGPASFNAEMHALGHSVTSFDPIYRFRKSELKVRIEQVKKAVLKQTSMNKDNFVWTQILDLAQLEQVRMSAMETFLSDFENGKKEQRYINIKLPNRIDGDCKFDLALSSHFLLLYDQLGLSFHIKAIREIMRVSRELRIFPLVNLNAKKISVLQGVQNAFKCDVVSVEYEFQKGANEMLVITN